MDIIEELNKKLLKEYCNNNEIFKIYIDKDEVLMNGKYYKRISKKQIEKLKLCDKDFVYRIWGLFLSYRDMVGEAIEEAEHDIGFYSLRPNKVIKACKMMIEFIPIFENARYNVGKIHGLYRQLFWAQDLS